MLLKEQALPSHPLSNHLASTGTSSKSQNSAPASVTLTSNPTATDGG